MCFRRSKKAITYKYRPSKANSQTEGHFSTVESDKQRSKLCSIFPSSTSSFFRQRARNKLVWKKKIVKNVKILREVSAKRVKSMLSNSGAKVLSISALSLIVLGMVRNFWLILWSNNLVIFASKLVINVLICTNYKSDQLKRFTKTDFRTKLLQLG